MPKGSPSKGGAILDLPSGPSVAVLPLNVPALYQDKEDFDDALNLSVGLQFALVAEISHFKDIMIISANEFNIADVKSDYVLSGIIQVEDDRIQVTSSLSSRLENVVIWSRSYNEPLITAGGILKIQAKISEDVAVTLGQPYSALNQSYAGLLSSDENANINEYLCLSRFYSYMVKKDPVEHKYLRDCLEAAVASNPDFSTGWAALSWIYGDETRNNFNPTPDEEPAYRRALRAAQRAVEANPQNGTAHQYLAMARYMNDDIIGFRTAAKRALALNPNDTEILADIGSYLILLDNSDEGRYMVEKAILLNPGHPNWYHGSIFMYFYTRGQSERALFHARQFSADQSLLSQMGLTICLVQSGDLEAARVQFTKLKKLYPDFLKTYDAELDAMRLPKGMKAQAIEDLKQVGLETS